MKLLINFENHFRNPLQRPYSGDFDPERKSPVILENHTERRKPPDKSRFWLIFTATNEGSTLENIETSSNHNIWNSEEGFSKHFSKIFSNSIEASKKLIFLSQSKV